MGADSNGSQAKGGASGKGGTQADSNGARKKTSAPSVHDARKVSCPLILLGSVSARVPDFLNLNQASGRSDRSEIGPPTLARVIAQLSDELSVGAAHSRSCASGNTLAPAGITHGLYFQGCADREWLPPIKLKSAMLLAPGAQLRDASLRHSITSLQENFAHRLLCSDFIESSSIWIFFAAEELTSIFSTLQLWSGGAARCR
jgi:hypothetical protein